VGRLRVAVGLLAMFVGGGGVLLGLVMLAGGMVVGRLVVMMGRGVVVSGGIVMVLGGGMLGLPGHDRLLAGVEVGHTHDNKSTCSSPSFQVCKACAVILGFSPVRNSRTAMAAAGSLRLHGFELT
jgi:hypothetical protein